MDTSPGVKDNGGVVLMWGRRNAPLPCREIGCWIYDVVGSARVDWAMISVFLTRSGDGGSNWLNGRCSWHCSGWLGNAQGVPYLQWWWWQQLVHHLTTPPSLSCYQGESGAMWVKLNVIDPLLHFSPPSYCGDGKCTSMSKISWWSILVLFLLVEMIKAFIRLWPWWFYGGGFIPWLEMTISASALVGLWQWCWFYWSPYESD